MSNGISLWFSAFLRGGVIQAVTLVSEKTLLLSCSLAFYIEHIIGAILQVQYQVKGTDIHFAITLKFLLLSH